MDHIHLLNIWSFAAFTIFYYILPPPLCNVLCVRVQVPGPAVTQRGSTAWEIDTLSATPKAILKNHSIYASTKYSNHQNKE